MMDKKNIILSAQRTFRGVEIPNIQAITIRFTSKPILLRAYFNEKPSESECDLIKKISNMLIIDFNEITEVREEFFVNETIICLDEWIYLQLTDM